MRELNGEELSLVTGSESHKNCSDENSENDYGGVVNAGIGNDLMSAYQALVAATTDLIERVALGLK